MAGHLSKVLDELKAMWAGHTFIGAAIDHRRLPGARFTRVMHPPCQRIAPHDHDWPVLALYRIGAYREMSENGAVLLDGPSAVFHPSGAVHEDEIGDAGLETLSLTFDPAWLDADARAALPARSLWRAGGAVADATRALAKLWLSPAAREADLRAETSRFVREALSAEAPVRPNWLDRVSSALERDGAGTQTLARELDRHPAWLARAYRAFRGEGIAETMRRHRIERATIMLRSGGETLADIAAANGFCDQSHMNRCFRAVLGRTPLQVRAEAGLLAAVGA